MAIASFDIDAQNTFTPVCSEELPVPDGDSIVAELNAQAILADLRIGSKDAHSPHAVWIADEHNPQFSPVQGANVDVRWKMHAVPGTKGFELLAGLPAITDYDFFVWKGIEPDMHPYGACYHDFAERLSTGVIEYLHQKQVTTVLAGGLATDYCVKLTVLQLQRAGFQVYVNLSACRGIAKNTTEQAIVDMQGAGVKILACAQELKMALRHLS
jgi:nicotinamidase/pyrazinamidase